MFRDEIAWIQPAVGLFAVTGTKKWGNEFAHFKMEVRKILTVGRSNGGDLLTAPHIVPRIHQARAVFLDRMQDNNDVAPAGSTIARQQNAAISNGVNWIA